jgi:hypothetical protein
VKDHRIVSTNIAPAFTRSLDPGRFADLVRRRVELIADVSQVRGT